jgi:diguanylate cyclase (GGDEF)-like protein
MPEASGRSGGLLRERMIIRRTAEMLVSASPPDVLFPRVCDLLASQFGAHFVGILEALEDDEKLRLRWSFSAGDDSLSAALEEISGDALDIKAPSVHPITPEQVALFIPLRYGSRFFGYLALGGGARRFTPEHVALLQTCARYMAVALFNVTLTEEKERLETLATRDALTGAYNRRAFDDRLAKEWRRAARTHVPLSMIMVDIDYFKVYNDAYGHMAGDHCLQQVAHALMGCVSRPDDLVARYGGEEFVALLPDTPEQGAVDVAERMCKKIVDLHIVHRGSELDRVSISVGVSTIVPRAGDRSNLLLAAADAALYRAKEGGRNRVAAGTYVSDTPPARRRFEGRSNLPVQLTSFIGREAELSTIVGALPISAVISILGPGGVGKTRLALAAAQAALETFPGGVWLIEVGAERDEARLEQLVAQKLGLPGRSPLDEILGFLLTTPALLVLDSCEHLLGACKSLCAQVAQHCPDARIITTSRQPLEIPGEFGLRLEPFELTDAMKLFMARARDVRSDFSLGASGDIYVAEICKRVDCLPLAIELAAMRLRNMSLQQLVEHGSPLPHPTDLHERIAWSFDLLAEAERRYLARLSVLRGPFDEEAARAVAGCDTFDAETSFEILTRLVEKSLVQVDLESGRYRLLSTIADYVRARLLEFDDPRKIRVAATQHYAQTVASLHEDLRAGRSAQAFARYSCVAVNVEAALEWALAGENVELGSALTADMAPYWIEIGHMADARVFLDNAIACGDRLSRRRILDILEPAVEVAAAGSDDDYIERLAERLRAETGTSNDGLEVARVMLALALARSSRGNVEEAASLFHHASNAFRIAGDARSLARSLLGWSQIVAEQHGDVPQAISLLNEALTAARNGGSPSLVIDVLAELVELTTQRGDETEAIEIVNDVAAQCEEFGDEASAIATTLLLARLEMRTDPVVGRMHARDALDRLRIRAHPGRLAACFELFARIAIDADQDETAARLLAFASNLRRTHGVAGSLHERRGVARLWETLAGTMEKSAFDRAQREGRAMTLDAAVHKALVAGGAASPGSIEALMRGVSAETT